MKPGPRLLRRLTGAQYDRTVERLLGLRSLWGAQFVTNPVVDGFDNHADALTVNDLLGDQIREAAEALVDHDPGARSIHESCLARPNFRMGSADAVRNDCRSNPSGQPVEGALMLLRTLPA